MRRWGVPNAECGVWIAEYKKQNKELGNGGKEGIGRGGVRVNVRTLLRYLGKTGKVYTE